jgi:arsenate reductase
MAGSYEALFSKKTTYKSMGLKDKNLDEADYKKQLEVIILLSRPYLLLQNILGIHSKICCK